MVDLRNGGPSEWRTPQIFGMADLRNGGPSEWRGAPPRGSYDVLLDECLQTRSVYTFIQQHVVATLSKLALQQLHYIARVRVMKVTCIM